MIRKIWYYQDAISNSNHKHSSKIFWFGLVLYIAGTGEYGSLLQVCCFTFLATLFIREITNASSMTVQLTPASERFKNFNLYLLHLVIYVTLVLMLLVLAIIIGLVNILFLSTPIQVIIAHTMASMENFYIRDLLIMAMYLCNAMVMTSVLIMIPEKQKQWIPLLLSSLCVFVIGVLSIEFSMMAWGSCGLILIGICLPSYILFKSKS